MSETLAGIFASAVERFPRRPFVHQLGDGREDRATYGQMAVRVVATLERLEALAAGDRVITYLDDLVPSLTFMLAAAHAGVVLVPMSPASSVEAVRQVVARTHPKAIFTAEQFVPALTTLGIPLYAYVSGPAAAQVHCPLPSSNGMSEHDAASILRSTADLRRPDDTAFILPTSGTTGEPKLVVSSHRRQIHDGDTAALGAVAEDEPPQRVLLLHTVTHAAGLFMVHMAIRVAAELCIPSRIDVNAPLAEVRRLDPTQIILAPRVLRSLYGQHLAAGAKESRMFGSGLQVLVCGGSAAEVEVLRYVAAQNVAVVEGYGSSESGLLAFTRKGDWREGYVGKALPGVTLRIADDGELLAKPAAPMVGYLDAPALTREAFTEDGFYRTGDFGELSTDGYLRVLGRKRDVFNTFDGSNVYPERIELLVSALPWVKQVVLVGDQRPYFGALIVVSDPTMDGRPGDGYLEDPALYDRARRDIQRINSTLERVERVRRIALFAHPFPSAFYAAAQLGKIRRDRPRLNEAYSSHINAFYTTGLSEVASVPDE